MKFITTTLIAAIMVCCAHAQEMDTIHIDHKVALRYDSKQWSAPSRSDYGIIPFGHNEVGFRIQPTTINNSEPICYLTVYFMDDTVTVLKDWTEDFKTRAVSKNNAFLIDSLATNGFQFYVIRTIPDECANPGKKVSPTISITGYADIGEEFFVELNYFITENSYTKDKWSLAKQFSDALILRSVKEADTERHYPYTKSYVDSLITANIAEIDTGAFSLFLQKRKCFDDKYLIESLEKKHGKPLIADLIEQKNDNALARLYTDYKIEEFKEGKAKKLMNLYETQYSYTEINQLRRRLRDEKFPIEDYFDMQCDLKRNSIFKRLDELDALTVPKMLNASTAEVLPSRYVEALQPFISAPYFEFSSSDYLKNEDGFLLQISGRNTSTGKSQYMLLSVQPNDSGGFNTLNIPMPTLKQEYDFGVWEFVKTWQQDFVILYNTAEYIHYIAPMGTTANGWQALPLFNFKSADVLLYNLMDADNINTIEVDQYYTDYAKWKGSDKKKFEDALLKYEEYDLIKEEGYPYEDYLIDEDAKQHYKEEYNEFPLWGEYIDIPIFLNDTAYLEADEYTEMLGYYLHPRRQGYVSPFYVEDLNGDSIADVFQFSICNGQLVHYQFFTKQGKEVVEMKNKKVEKWITEYSDCVNLKLKSQMGNFWSDERFFQYLYSREPRRTRFTGTPSF